MGDKKSIVNTPLFYGLILLCCVLWASAFAGAKLVFNYCSPILLSGFRFSLAGLLLVPMLFFDKKPFFSLFKHWRYMLLFGFIQTFLQYGIFFLGLNEVPGAVAAIVVGTGPIFITIMAHFSINDEKFTTRKIISCLLGFSGIIFISLTKDGIDTVSDNLYYGIALLVLSNIIGASTNIIVRKQKHLNVSPIALTAFANFSGGVMLLIVALLFDQGMMSNPPIEFYLGLLWLAIIPAVGFSVWYYLLEQDGVKVSELNIWKFIIPIIGSVLSWILLEGENPRWQEFVGIVIISASIILLQYSPKKKK